MEENKIIIYQTEDGQTQIDVRLENDTVWLTQKQIAELFGTKRLQRVRAAPEKQPRVWNTAATFRTAWDGS